MAKIEKATVPALPAGHRRLIYAGAAALALLLGACAESPNIATFEASGDAKTRAEKPSAASPDTLIRLADAARAMGNRADAAGFYNRAAQTAPNDPELQVRLGFMLHELGAQLEAEAAFRRAIAADLGNADALRGLGITLIARDMPHHAIEYLEEAIAARPDSRAYNAMGVALDMVGERASAREAYGAGLAGDPENLSLLNNLGLSLTLSGRYAEAIAVLGRAADNPTATPRHRQNLALAYGLEGRLDKAAEVANIDLDMRSVRNNLGYYAWLRRQPNEQTEQALGANLDAAPPIQLADNAFTPARELAPEPPLAVGAAPTFDGALFEGGPVVLTPRSQTGSLSRDYDAKSAAPSLLEPTAPAATRGPALREPAAQIPPPEGNVIWELKSVETDDPAANDADGKGADTKGEKQPDSKGDTPSVGQNDEAVDRDAGKPSRSVVKKAQNAATVADSSEPANEYANSAPAVPPAAPATDSPTTKSEVRRQAATAAAPPATQIAAMSLVEVAQDASIEKSTRSTAQASDNFANDMAIELPASRDDRAIPEFAADFDADIEAFVIQAEGGTPRQANSLNTLNAGDREEHGAVPVPFSLIDDGETGTLETGEVSASDPESSMRADNMGVDASSTGATTDSRGERRSAPATGPATGRPPMARESAKIDMALAANEDTTIATERPPPSEFPSNSAAESMIANLRDVPNAPAGSSSNGPDTVEPREPADAGPPLAQIAVNVADPPKVPAEAAVTPIEAADYTDPTTKKERNAVAPRESLLALASPPRSPTPGPRAAVHPQPAEAQPAGPQPAAVPQAGAKSAEWPPRGGRTESTRLLRSGMSLGLGPSLWALREGHDGPRQLASAEAAAGSVGRLLVGSLARTDPEAAAPTAATLAPEAPTRSGAPMPTYGLAALILAGLLSLLWASRRGQGDADGGARTDTASEAES